VGVGLTAAVDQPVMYARTLYLAVEVSAGSAADLGTLTLQVPLRQYELHGKAVDAGGAPVAGASIWNAEWRRSGSETADGERVVPRKQEHLCNSEYSSGRLRS
jgi:hypothetical protein